MIEAGLQLTYRGALVLPDGFEQPDIIGLEFGEYGRQTVARWGADKLLKLSEEDGKISPGYETDAEEVLRVAGEHTSQLREFGLNIPEHVRSIGMHPKLPRIVLYALVSEIDGVPLTSDFTFQSPMLRDQVIDPLISYYHWTIDTAQPSFLVDIPHRDQFIFGRPKDDPKSEPKIWLVDIDPRVAKTRERLYGEVCCLDEIIGEYGYPEGGYKPWKTLLDKVDTYLAHLPA